MRFGDWLRLIASGRFAVTVNCLPRIVGTTLITPVNSFLGLLSDAIHGRRAEAVTVTPPIFILGHWRTGTTLLHELFAEDPAMATPTVFQCLFPNAFLIAPGIAPLLNLFLSPTRVFDNVPMSYDRPQEDEFAVLNCGMGTPYRSLAFPRHGLNDLHYLDLAEATSVERQAWEAAYLTLIKRFQLVHGKRLVLKSPLHTGRIATLARLFPGARFIHLARNPFEVFPSSVNTFHVMGSWQGLHNPGPSEDTIKEWVLDVFERLFAAYERDRPSVAPGHLAEVRYEDLTADPEGTLRGIYETLGLDGFEAALPRMRTFLAVRSSYRRNSFVLGDDDRVTIRARWRRYFERFGYSTIG